VHSFLLDVLFVEIRIFYFRFRNTRALGFSSRDIKIVNLHPCGTREFYYIATFF